MKSPAFSHYVKDSLCSARQSQMSGDAYKAFWTLLEQSWLQEPRATLPASEDDLIILARVSPAKWQAIRAEVMPMFVAGEGSRIYNERLMVESQKQDNRSRAGKDNVTKRHTKSLPNTLPTTLPTLEDANAIGSNESSYPELLNEETCLTQAEMKGIPRDFAKFVYLNWWTTGGKNANGVAVEFDRYVFKRWTSERAEWQAGTHKGKKAQEAKVSAGPTRADVTKYAKEKGDENGIFAVSFYRHWESKGWKNLAGKSIDWQIKFSEQFAQHRGKNL